MENKQDLVTKLIKEAKKNGFKFGNFIKAPEGFRFYNFDIQGGDVLGYGVELKYAKSTPAGSDFEVIYFDFTSFLLSKKFMTKLLKKRGESLYRQYYTSCLYKAHDNGINTAIDYLIDLLEIK